MYNRQEQHWQPWTNSVHTVWYAWEAHIELSEIKYKERRKLARVW